MKENTIIMFNQAIFNIDKKQQIKIAEKRFNEVMKAFSKSPLMQLKAFYMWDKIIRLSEPVSKGEFSDYILSEIESVCADFEDFQNNPQFTQLKNDIINVVLKCNELGVI